MILTQDTVKLLRNLWSKFITGPRSQLHPYQPHPQNITKFDRYLLTLSDSDGSVIIIIVVVSASGNESESNQTAGRAMAAMMVT